MKRRKRRGNHEGTIYLRPDGLWVGQATIGKNTITGKTIRRSIYGHTRSEVAIKLTYLLGEVYKYGYISESQEPLKEIMLQWLLVYKRSLVTSRTFEGNISIAKNNIFPYIGNTPVSRISSNNIQNLLQKILHSEKGLSIETVKKSKFLLNQFFIYLVQSNQIRRNPVISVTLKSNEEEKTRQQKYKALRYDKRMEFLKTISGHDFLYPLCIVVLFTGLRIGEVLALKWEDISFIEKHINIKSAITIKVDFDKYGNATRRSTIVGTTKTTSSNRKNPLSDTVMETLIRFKENKHLQGFSIREQDYIFNKKDGSARTCNGTARLLNSFLKKKKFTNPQVNFRMLRHTFSTILFEANDNLKSIQLLLGHKSERTTLGYYGSLDNTHFHTSIEIIDTHAKQVMQF